MTRTSNGFENILGFFLEGNENVVFEIETNLFDVCSRLEMIRIDHLCYEEESIFEDI